MATIIKGVPDLFNPPEILYTHQVLSEKINKNNVAVTGLYDPNTNPSSPWRQMRYDGYTSAPLTPPNMDNGVYLIRGLSAQSYENIFGFLMNGRGETGVNPTKSVTHELKFTFRESVRDISNGSLYDLNIALTKVDAVSQAKKLRFMSVVSLGGSTPSNTPNFFIQAYLGVVSSDSWVNGNSNTLNWQNCGENSDPGCAASISINIYVTDSNGNIVPNVKLLYPFTDIDQGGSVFTIGGYSESITLTSSSCEHIYYQANNTSVSQWHTSWLNCNGVAIADGTYSPSSGKLTFSNGKVNSDPNNPGTMQPDDSPGGRTTGIMAVINTGQSGFVVQWNGAKCGTSIKGEPSGTGLFSITLDSNGGANNATVPYKTYYVQGQPVSTPDGEPTRSSKLIFDVNHENGANPSDELDPSRISIYRNSETKAFDFLGWSRTKYNESKLPSDNVVEYGKNVQLTSSIQSDISLYAVWTHPKIESVPEYHEPDSGLNWITRKDSASYRLDPNTPWTTTRNGSISVDVTKYLSKNTTIYAKWNYLINIDADPGKIARRYLNDLVPFNKESYWKIQGEDLSYEDFPELDYTEYIGERGIIRPGYKAKNLYLESDPSITYDLDLVYDIDRAGTLRVGYDADTVTIIFKDGYSPKDSDTIRTLVKNYGYQLNIQEDVPVPGTGTFVNPNPNDRFMGWSISLTDDQGYPIKIYSDIVITAIWGYTPIWIMVPDDESPHGKKWVKYEPKEEQE